MKQTFLAMAMLPFLAGAASAAQPLNDPQLDKVTAGHTLFTVETTNSTFVEVAIGTEICSCVATAASTDPENIIPVGQVVLPAASLTVLWGIVGEPPQPPKM
jgi:hypothetical protein